MIFRLYRVSSSIPSARNLSTSIIRRNEILKSSCVAGTVLNLKIKKNGDEPVALEDKEYPAWLWDCLDAKKLDRQLKKEDYMKWKKKQVNKANTKKIKNNNFLSKM